MIPPPPHLTASLPRRTGSGAAVEREWVECVLCNWRREKVNTDGLWVGEKAGTISYAQGGRLPNGGCLTNGVWSD